MVKVDFYPLDFAYETVNNKAVIQIFGRTANDKKICVLDDNFEPYFYIIPDKKENINKLCKRLSNVRVDDKNEPNFVIKTEVEKKKYYGKEISVVKVIVNHPSSVKVLREEVKDFNYVKVCVEADILFTKRYLMDMKLNPLIITCVEGDFVERDDLEVDVVIRSKKIGQDRTDIIEKPKILAFDIETYNSKGVYPNFEKDPIIMLSFYGEKFKKVLTWKVFDEAQDYVEFVENERELLLRFNEIIIEQEIDYLTGYFSDGFDLPYIYERAKKNKVKIKINESSLRLDKRAKDQNAIFKGIVHLDVLKFIKDIMGDSLRFDNYKLDSVASELLGEKKVDVDLSLIGKAWDKNSDELKKYCEYNLQDSKLTYDLLEKILPNLNELVRLIGQPIYDICRMSYSRMVEFHLMKRAVEENELYPNKPNREEVIKRRGHTYEGAFVFEPKPGLYENLVVLDFRSLYPSLIVAKNIDPGRLTKEKKGSHETPKVEGEERHYFDYGEEGFIPKIIKDILVRRGRIKELIKKDKYNPILNARSYALKTIANATYGYFGFSGARWYCKECASAITAFAREYIKEAIKSAEKSGFEIVYSDTDSIFMGMGKKSKRDVNEFLEKENRELPSLMELELEDFYPRGIFVMKKDDKGGAKKKYALISDDGKIKVRGFETVRRDWSLIAKETQKDVLKIILEENNVEKAYKYVRKVIEDIKDKKIDMKKMIIQTQLKKNLDNYDLEGPHVYVGRKMKAKGILVGAGTIINYVVKPGKGLIRARADIPEDAKDYDSEYYIKKQVIPAIERIFNALGYDTSELIEGKKQKKIGDF